MLGSSRWLTVLGTVVQPAVDTGDFRDPALPLAVLQREDLIVRPVKMKRDVRYLLVQPL